MAQARQMTKQEAHFQAFGYEPLRMKPAHFASGFFISLTGEVFANKLLNHVAVIKSNKGLLEAYRPEEVAHRLKMDNLILDDMSLSAVELLRVQVNGVVNNDDAMYPALRGNPYSSPKGNDYTFLSRRLLTSRIALTVTQASSLQAFLKPQRTGEIGSRDRTDVGYRACPDARAIDRAAT